MTNWIETYRGAVPPWQCDVTEHFTVAYYFDRIEEADANLADALGIGHFARRGDVPRTFNARFVRELREGASFHIESAALAVDDGLRLGHRVVDSATDETVTWFDSQWDLSAAPLTDTQRAAILPQIAAWPGPATESRPDPVASANVLPTARGRVKPADVDASGHFALGAMVHRFSNASAQTGAVLGMTAEVMQQQRRGFSTFELILRQSSVLPVDAPYLVQTGIALFGNSSMRMVHRMTDPRSGALVAQLSQYGVNLDLDARRPARWSDAIRERAQRLIVPVA